MDHAADAGLARSGEHVARAPDVYPVKDANPPRVEDARALEDGSAIGAAEQGIEALGVGDVAIDQGDLVGDAGQQLVGGSGLDERADLAVRAGGVRLGAVGQTLEQTLH